MMGREMMNVIVGIHDPVTHILIDSTRIGRARGVALQRAQGRQYGAWLLEEQQTKPRAADVVILGTRIMTYLE